MHNRTLAKHGFTLVELMIVVAIIGILAGVAIPSMTYFIKNSKTSDGRDKLSALAQGAITYYNAEHHYAPNGLKKTAHLYPGCQEEYAQYSACQGSVIAAPGIGEKTIPASGVFSNEPWKRLAFEVAGPVYYGYSYISTDEDANTFTACAAASLASAHDSQFIISGTSDGRLTPMQQLDNQALNASCNGITQ